MKAPKLSVKRYKHSDKSRFVVDGLRINGKRVRRFFATRQEADTFAGQKQIQLENLGLRALEMPDGLRVMAIECAEKLKPSGKTLRTPLTITLTTGKAANGVAPLRN